MSVRPLSDNAKPSVLFRAESGSNTNFREGYLCARRTIYEDPPSWQEFDNHLSWKRKYTRFLSFGTWKRAMQRLKNLESKGERNVVMIAVWVKGLAGVYSAEEAASGLGYSDTGRDRRRKLWHHRDEYLVEGGIAADEYRILAVFEGGGPEHEIVFECPLYRVPAMIPSGFFPGRRSGNALQDIVDEIYSHSGVFDDMKRDELVKAITRNPQFSPTIRYQCPGLMKQLQSIIDTFSGNAQEASQWRSTKRQQLPTPDKKAS
ncbi:uncharacterized protein BO96DRAFT_437954 [Aspergillus niger CBS 101883]|uniref:uncharacterized protein n=1 Tax=Aspergillus lacticoffeatus (strain CBS 101883) TaxID=1450533 RepID=UPI000D7F6B35|nr:uncharacterized protein BO96DRAFT_437954 [Aspergillus niger CBS 101883]PYH52386.1 hypothetical protein BO96DRAFT_437954 [Aspergillus niger CBS 101883]